MKKNIEQKYFAKQTARLVLNITFGAITALGAVLFTVIRGGGPLGITCLLIGIIALIFTNSGRVTDKDFDRYMKDKLKDELAVEQPDYSAEVYDPTAAHCKIGKDKKIRTDILCQTRVYRSKSTLRVVSRRAQMDAEDCEVHELEAPLSEVCIRIEEAREGHTNKPCCIMTVEAADGRTITFPVTSDYATEQFAEEINSRSGYLNAKREVKC